MRIVFCGTPDYAVPSLKRLWQLAPQHQVVAVVSQPDRPKGRSGTPVPPPVAQAARELGLASQVILQPQTINQPELLRHLRALAPDLLCVIAYGHILKKAALALPRLFALNAHGSLLPKFRGAAPIQAAVREGLRETGVTIMRMVLALDAGPIVLQARTPIASDETAGELELRLSELGAMALVEAITLIELGQESERPQEGAAATYAPKIEREMARVNWQEGCSVIARTIRAYDPRPGAFTTHRGADLKLFGADETEEAGDEGSTSFGTVLAIDERGMLVACGDGAVRVSQVTPAGKKRLSVAEWLRGRGVAIGERLGG
jgi:methionyl-tRNA formyltransferase